MELNQSYKLLIVEDDVDIVALLTYNLEKEGYELKTATDGKQALELIQGYQPHLILMDIMLPHLDGIETARRIREMPQMEETLIVFLTARSEEYAQIAAFDSGADDYITKPIKPRALLSRIQALLKRKSRQVISPDRLTLGELIIDKQTFVVTHQGRKLNLPKKEFELLYFLASHPNRVYTRNDLLHYIWGADLFISERTVDVHIRKIREKIGEHYIKTIKGVGYIWETAD